MAAAYRRKAGAVMSAQLLDYKLHSGKRKGHLSHAQRAGIKYEAQALVHLGLELDRCSFHPALKFTSKSASFPQYCIPDAIALNDRGDIVTIIEVKCRHTLDGWNQLHNLYLPVVQKIWPEKKINLLEICKDYDPSVSLPGDHEVISDLASWVERAHTKYGVYIWSDRDG